MFVRNWKILSVSNFYALKAKKRKKKIFKNPLGMWKNAASQSWKQAAHIFFFFFDT